MNQKFNKFVIEKQYDLESTRGVFAQYAKRKPKLTQERLKNLRKEFYSERNKMVDNHG